MISKILNNLKIQSVAMLATFLFLVYLSVAYTIPTSVYVDFHLKQYNNMCVGSDTQTLTTRRDVWPTTGIPAVDSSEIVQFIGQRKNETIVKRYKPYSYQYETEEFDVTIVWDHPMIEMGSYGVSGTITINPLPMVFREIVIVPEYHRFDVVECT